MIHVLDHLDGEKCFFNTETQQIIRPKKVHKITDNHRDIYELKENETIVIAVTCKAITGNKNKYATFEAKRSTFNQLIKGHIKYNNTWITVMTTFIVNKVYLLNCRKNEKFKSSIEIINYKQL